MEKEFEAEAAPSWRGHAPEGAEALAEPSPAYGVLEGSPAPLASVSGEGAASI